MSATDTYTSWAGHSEDEPARFESQTQARRVARRVLKEMLAPHKGVLAFGTLLVLLRNAAALSGPYLVKVGIDTTIPTMVDTGSRGPLVMVTTAFVGAGLLQAVCDYWSLSLIGRLGQTMLFELRTRLFGHVQALGLNFQERFTSGRIISRLTSDIDAVDELLTNGLQQVAWSTLIIVSSTGMLFFLDWRLALVVTAFVPLVVIATRWFKTNALNAFRRRSETVALVIMHFVESVRAIAAVQAFRREDRNQIIFGTLNEDYRQAKQNATRLIALYGPIVRAFGNSAIAAVMVTGGIWVLDDKLTVGVLAAFVLYLRRMVEPAMEMSYFYGAVQSAAAALEKISLVLDERPVIEEAADPVVLGHCDGEVRFERVTFGYGTNRPVLNDLDLVIPAGQTIALVGETGAGKSTIARLIARLYDPTNGTVFLDGIDLRRVSTASLRHHLVMLTQENFLFSETVGANIRLGRPDATDDDVIAAARALGANDFIERLPNGYETFVGKRGAELSAGQRQLIAFTRAFLANPQVLVLDEATSSIDIPSERLVQHALQVLLADRTAIVIAHRLSTVDIADRVLVVDQGRVVEDGSPQTLVSGNGQFRALHDAWRQSMQLD